MKNMVIGILGCLVNTQNLGCVALSYSLIQMLESISKDLAMDFRYVIFDEKPSNHSIDLLCKRLRIDSNSIEVKSIGEPQINSFRNVIRASTKYLSKNIQMIHNLRKCDVVIDLTGGDSFSDIYGKDRFYKQTTIKRLVEMMNIPLILGPQTYGPYLDNKVKVYAKKTIERAYLVLSRDVESKQYVQSFCDKSVVDVTDLAFGLKYQKPTIAKNEKLRIGINPSGLLGKKKVEHTTLNNKLKADYEKYLERLVETLVQSNSYEVHLIPHVGNEAVECFSGFEQTIYHEAFDDPIAAKELISTMDVFVGSRMHATIGAFSAGVPTIPVAYSKKFKGLYSSIGYEYIVDLQELDENAAVMLTKEYIDRKDELKKAIIKSSSYVAEKYSILRDSLEYSLKGIIH